MKVKIDASALRQSKWYEYVVRFAFGGAVTALTGLVAKRFGPAVGGLFLAFPAILPATATLLESDERQKKERAGMSGIIRGREAAGVDAAGSAMGGVGLAVFAIMVWRLLPQSTLLVVLGEATIAWFVVSVAIWFAKDKLRRRFARRCRKSFLRQAPVRGQGAPIDRRRDE